MKYEEYLHKCATSAYGPNGVWHAKMRIGQFYVNQLPGNMAQKLHRAWTSNDPFYNDQRLPAFFKWLEENWEDE